MEKQKNTILKYICLAFSILIISGCGNKTNVSQDKLHHLDEPDSVSTEINSQTIVGERYDPATEEVVAQECLTAWRLAIANDKQGKLSDNQWNKIKRKNEEDAIQQLNNLAKRYPSSSTVQFMMGQIEDHLGKKPSAIKFYQRANVLNSKSPMYLFKLAESLRQSNKTGEAIKYYRELLEVQSDFVPGQIGLAKALLANDKHSAEAKTILSKIVAQDPANKEAAEILSTIEAK